MNEQHLTILLAEDDPDDQELIINAFSKVDPNFRLHVVNDGKEAIQFLETASDNKLPCLIVLDYNMPELNGAQVVQMLNNRKRYDRIPKVILSTANNPKYIEDCLNKGAQFYKVKPDNFQQLVHIAEEMMALCKNAA
jgi:CheY-like chemotaxis protein